MSDGARIIAEQRPFDLVGAVIDFENGDMSEDDIIDLFQYLVDTGLAWKLQGSYGRMAAQLIENEVIRA